MSFVKTVNHNQPPHLVGKDIRWRVVNKYGITALERNLEEIGQDGKEIIELRDLYKQELYRCKERISTLSGGIDMLDDAIANLLLHNASMRGYELAEETYKTEKREKKSKKITASQSYHTQSR